MKESQNRSHKILDIDRRLQIFLTIVGATILTYYWKSWKDVTHLIYDLPAAIAMCAFIAQIICEAKSGMMTKVWWAKVISMIPMAVIPSGREFLGWSISGHLTDMAAVPLIQSTDTRLKVKERLLYWIPLPAVLYIRLSYFDQPGHEETLNALIAALSVFFLFLIIRYNKFT